MESTGLRRDAARNRDRIVAAARDVFAEDGLDAPLTRVAEVAGVGRGSLYRRFPDRGALILAIFADNFDLLEATSTRLADRPERFREVVLLLIELCTQSQGFLGLVMGEYAHDPRFAGLEARLEALLEPPVTAAVATGDLPAEWTAADVALVMSMLSGIIGAAPLGQADALVRRALRLLGLADALDLDLDLD